MKRFPSGANIKHPEFGKPWSLYYFTLGRIGDMVLSSQGNIKASEFTLVVIIPLEET